MAVKSTRQSSEGKKFTVQFKIFKETTAFRFSCKNTWSEDLYFVISGRVVYFS